LGAATAKLFASLGAKLTLTGRNEVNLKFVADVNVLVQLMQNAFDGAEIFIRYDSFKKLFHKNWQLLLPK